MVVLTGGAAVQAATGKATSAPVAPGPVEAVVTRVVDVDDAEFTAKSELQPADPTARATRQATPVWRARGPARRARWARVTCPTISHPWPGSVVGRVFHVNVRVKVEADTDTGSSAEGPSGGRMDGRSESE